jgi:hypothetical protein
MDLEHTVPLLLHFITVLGEWHDDLDLIIYFEQSLLCFVSKSSATSRYDNNAVTNHSIINISGANVLLNFIILKSGFVT